MIIEAILAKFAVFAAAAVAALQQPIVTILAIDFAASIAIEEVVMGATAVSTNKHGAVLCRALEALILTKLLLASVTLYCGHFEISLISN